MRAIFFACLAAMSLTGCATKAVIEASREQDVDLRPETVPVKLLWASVVEDGDGAESQSHLYLCLSRMPNGETERSFLVRIAEPYPFADDDRSTYRADSGLVLRAGGYANLFEGCPEPPRARLVTQLPIIEAKRGRPVALPKGDPDAFVVSPKGESGLGLAYMSAAPIFGGYHAVAIDLSRSPLYVEHQEGRPYLLLLTPVTALGDVTFAATVGAVVFLAEFIPGACCLGDAR